MLLSHPPLWLTTLGERLADSQAVEGGDHLLDRLEDEGLPWNLSVKDATKRNRKARWFDFQDVILMKAITVLGLPASDWYARLRHKDETVSDFFADFWLDENVRKNHEAVRQILEQALGSGTETSVSNTVEHQWWFSYLRICVRSFPPDLQSPSLSTPLDERFPELKRKTSVEIESALAVTEPDSDLPRRFEEQRESAIVVEKDWAPVVRPQLCRRHAHLGTQGLLLWSDDAGVALSAARVSQRIPRGRKGTLRLVELTPARGGGSASLAYENGSGDELPFAGSGRFDALRELARSASERLEAKLVIESYPDE